MENSHCLLLLLSHSGIKVDPEDYYAQSVWYPDNTSFITVSEGEELKLRYR